MPSFLSQMILAGLAVAATLPSMADQFNSKNSAKEINAEDSGLGFPKPSDSLEAAFNKATPPDKLWMLKGTYLGQCESGGMQFTDALFWGEFSDYKDQKMIEFKQVTDQAETETSRALQFSQKIKSLEARVSDLTHQVEEVDTVLTLKENLNYLY